MLALRGKFQPTPLQELEYLHTKINFHSQINDLNLKITPLPALDMASKLWIKFQYTHILLRTIDAALKLDFLFKLSVLNHP